MPMLSGEDVVKFLEMLEKRDNMQGEVGEKQPAKDNTLHVASSAVSAAHEAAQGLTTPEFDAFMFYDEFEGDNTLHVASSAVSAAPEAAQRVTAPEIAASIAPDISQGVHTPKTAVTLAYKTMNRQKTLAGKKTVRQFSGGASIAGFSKMASPMLPKAATSSFMMPFPNLPMAASSSRMKPPPPQNLPMGGHSIKPPLPPNRSVAIAKMASPCDAAGDSHEVNSDSAEGQRMLGVVMPQVVMAVASDAVHDVIRPQVAMAAASDAVQGGAIQGGAIMPQVITTVASDAAQCVNTPKSTAPAVSTASEAAQGLTMPEIASSMLCDLYKADNTDPAEGQRMLGVVMPQVVMAVASDAVHDVIRPQVAMAAASDAVQGGAIMPQVLTTVASDAAQCVNTPKSTAPAVSTASEAAQGLTMPEIASSMLCDLYKADNTLHVASSAAYTASKAAEKLAMPDVAASIDSDVCQGVNTPKLAVGSGCFDKNPASALKQVFAMGGINDSCLEGENIRQIKPAHVDEKGKDIGGHWNLPDSVSVVIGCPHAVAWQWVKNHINAIKKIAPSLTYIDVGHSSVSFITLTPIHTRIHTSQYKHIFKC